MTEREVGEIRREPRIGDKGIAFEAISEGEWGICYFAGEAYDVKAATGIRKWREVVLVQVSPKALVTETGYTTPTKPTVTGGFEKWHVLWMDYIPANSSYEWEAYTVPDKWRLNLGLAVISCDVSVIQDVVMSHTPGIVGHFRYDVQGIIPFTELSSTLIESLETLRVFVYNNDVAQHFFSVAISGTLEKI